MKEEIETDYYYNTYQKVTTWKKDVYSIKANSKEEADEAMRLLFLENELHTGCENHTDALLSPHWCDHGDYYEGDDDLLTYEENNGVTEELYDESGELLENNEPLEIKREKKLNNLLG
jgi:hypothetical protein